eukprot:CAMPEP_0116878872 /NCGR_PEP_ID=MMETSP0463-20121206/10621_1 /TAXON_ID=181622 /ORGANISM="Strombidinopsis sp, Strain SopsisLIS2011" /LENGTH=104 /DNA_ID=CAMNT_0004527525 /DNA_START=26 /DNA_END=337 /DNA_ORIENTATION=+
MTNVDDVDRPDQSMIKDAPIEAWGRYFVPASLNKLVSRKWRFFLIPAIFGYLYNFIFALLAANFYSDWDRKLDCTGLGFDAVEENSAVFDTAITLLFVYHFIEW